MIIILSIITMLIFVFNSEIVLNGAAYGLMLWYKNVLPILLPFMLISGIMVNYIKSAGLHPTRKTKSAVFITILLGILCGYPLGAKTASDFVKEDIYDKSLGNVLLPICNNSSPMFISGYAIHTILRNRVTFAEALLAIYTPYIVMLIISYLFQSKKTNRTAIPSAKNNHSVNQSLHTNQTDYMSSAILQVTYVGVYIMLCSIIIEFLNCISVLPSLYTEIISGYTEITRGIMLISESTLYSENIKTALILSITSFGGISAILQTAKVIKDSGLSIISYIIMKTICSAGTLGMVLLLV